MGGLHVADRRGDILLAMFGAGASLNESVLAWGDGMWALLELGMQFSIAMIAAHACVSSRPVYRFLDWLACLPDRNKPVQAIALIGAYALVTGYLNWALSVVASALFVPFVARRNPKADIRVVIAAAYLGICTIWHGGLSGSAPLILATPGNPLLEPASGEPVIDRVLPVTETLFIPFNLVFIAILGAVALATVMLLHPRRNVQTLTSDQIDRMMPTLPEDQPPESPAGRMEAFPGWVILAAILIGYPLGYSHRHPRLRRLVDHQRLQRGLPGGGAAAPGPAVQPGARVRQRRPDRVRRHPAVPLLRGHLRRHQQHRPRRLARRAVRQVRHHRIPTRWWSTSIPAS